MTTRTPSRPHAREIRAELTRLGWGWAKDYAPWCRQRYGTGPLVASFRRGREVLKDLKAIPRRSR